MTEDPEVNRQHETLDLKGMTVHNRPLQARTYDVVVIGGGLAGVCAAVAAARSGVRVALVQDRPVLGGNSSSEVRVWAVGAASHGYFRHARETGIVEEVTLETAWRSEGLLPLIAEPWPMWDLVLKEWCDREPTLDLYLNTRAHAVVVQGSQIVAVDVLQISTEKAFRFYAAYFIDSSGDGEVAARAGAAWRLGQESRAALGESFAPETELPEVLPSTLMFSARDAGRPVPFHPPDWAYDFPADADLPFRHPTYFKSGYWWIEAGGDRDTIADNEEIRDDLHRILFGIWDHIKNHGDHGADNLVLDWVGHVVGKRESRRFVGDVTVTQDDVLDGRWSPDIVAYGGWPIDLHPSRGFFDPTTPSKMADPQRPFGIPYGALYSANVENLFLNGRLISASHIAMGAIRVQKTLALVGQAVGTAAALCVHRGFSPRQLGTHIKSLQQALLKQDCFLPGVRNEDPQDLARGATATASSCAPFPVVLPATAHGLYTRRAQVFPTAGGALHWVAAWLVCTCDTPVSVTARLYAAQDIWDLNSGTPLAETTKQIAPGHDGWVRFAFATESTRTGLCRLEIEASDGVLWRHGDEEPHGFQAAAWTRDRFSRARLDTPEPQREVGHVIQSGAGESYGTHHAYGPDGADSGAWRHLRGMYAIDLSPAVSPYGPANALSGYARPFVGADCWVSAPGAGWPQWLELEFPAVVTFDTVHLAFDSNLDRQMDEGPKALAGPVPEFVRAYTLEVWSNGTWVTLFDERDNHQRFRRHTGHATSTSRLRLVCHATVGGSDVVGRDPAYADLRFGGDFPDAVAVYDVACVFEVRVYEERATDD